MIFQLLDKVHKNGYDYVSWKNNHEIELVLSGASDLDIYVPQKFKDNFIELAKDEGWIIVKNPVAHYPEIIHFYNIDQQLKNYHIHVYFKVITGESWLKEYDLPIGDFLIENRIKHISGLFILNNEAQSFLFALRHFLKNYSWLSRILYKQELSSYQKEWDLCKRGFKPNVYPELIDLTNYMSHSGLNDKLILPQKSISKSVRTSLGGYLRLPNARLGILRWLHLKNLLLNRVFYKRKKTFFRAGFILAFSGADGVGKSTMSKSIGSAYSSFLTCKWVYPGKPQNNFIEVVRAFLNKPQRSLSESKPSASIRVGLKKAFMATILAYLRLKEVRKAQTYKEKGYLVISDRWPTLERGKMDGPQLNAKELSGIKKILAEKEQRCYEKMLSADLCIILTVPTTLAIRRNQDRVKKGKETDEEIIERHEQNAKHKPEATKIIVFDNNGKLSEKRYELIKIIQKEIFEGTRI